MRIRLTEDEAWDVLKRSYISATQDHYANRTFLRFVAGPRILTWDNCRIAPKERA